MSTKRKTLKLRYYEFKPYDGGEIERHTLRSLTFVADRRGMTDREVQRVADGDLNEVIAIKDVGEFKRAV